MDDRIIRQYRKELKTAKQLVKLGSIPQSVVDNIEYNIQYLQFAEAHSDLKFFDLDSANYDKLDRVMWLHDSVVLNLEEARICRQNPLMDPMTRAVKSWAHEETAKDAAWSLFMECN